jgi:hypothetical protein
MAQTTTIRIDRATHEVLKRLARERQTTVAETVARTVRVLRQEKMGHQAGPSCSSACGGGKRCPAALAQIRNTLAIVLDL